MSIRLIGVLAAMAALLAAGLSTGTRIYSNLFFILLLMVVYSLVSVLWTLFTVKLGMKGVRSRVERGEALMTILSLEHKSLLPAGSLRVELNVPGTGDGYQEIIKKLYTDRAYVKQNRLPEFLRKVTGKKLVTNFLTMILNRFLRRYRRQFRISVQNQE
jgi:hypothetical protein